MQSHRTQTNEVGRCAVFFRLALWTPGSRRGRSERRPLPAPRPVPLRIRIDVARCRVVSLFPCVLRWRIQFPPRGGAAHRLATSCSTSIRSTCDDDDAVRWLLACVWPDHPERRRRLEGRSRWPEGSRPSSAPATWSRISPRSWPRFRRMPSSSSSTRRSSATRAWTIDRRSPPSWPMRRGERRGVGVSNEGPGIVREVTALAPPARGASLPAGAHALRERAATGRAPCPVPPSWGGTHMAMSDATLRRRLIPRLESRQAVGLAFTG